MQTILYLLPLIVLAVGCQKQAPAPTAGATNMNPQEFARLVRQEKSKADAWFAALDAARPSAPLVVQFVQLFPAATVNYRYFTPTGEPGFDLSVDLHDRYELTMQLPVRFDPDGRNVVGYGEPKFHLAEAASQTGRATFNDPAGARQFGSDDWQKLVKSGGDFAAIGYSMITNQPIPSFSDRKDNP